MLIILYILTLGHINPNVATVNQVASFDSMTECNARAAKLNEQFKAEGKEYVAGCNANNDFVNGARMGAYSTIKKYEYCLLVSDLKNKPVADGFKECTKIITDDVEAIWPKDK